MPLVSVEFLTTDLNRVSDWLTTGLDKAVNDRDTWAAGAVKIAGQNMMNNFVSEGALWGRPWQNLTAFTQEQRVLRGFPPDHPILVQTGELRRMVEYLSKWEPGTKGFISSDKKGGDTTFSATWDGNSVFARLAGSKVANNFGGFASGFAGIGGVAPAGSSAYRYGAGAVVPRPFFFIDPRVVPLMAERTMGAFMGHWQSKGRGVKRSYGRMMVLSPGQKKKW